MMEEQQSRNIKLSQAQVDEIRMIYNPRSHDNNLKNLSKKYGVSVSHISRILRNERRKANKEA